MGRTKLLNHEQADKIHSVISTKGVTKSEINTRHSLITTFIKVNRFIMGVGGGWITAKQKLIYSHRIGKQSFDSSTCPIKKRKS